MPLLKKVVLLVFSFIVATILVAFLFFFVIPIPCMGPDCWVLLDLFYYLLGGIGLLLTLPLYFVLRRISFFVNHLYKIIIALFILGLIMIIPILITKSQQTLRYNKEKNNAPINF